MNTIHYFVTFRLQINNIFAPFLLNRPIHDVMKKLSVVCGEPLNQPVFNNTIIPQIINDAKSISTRLCKPLRQHDNATLWPFWANKVLISSEIIRTQNCPLRCQNLHSPLTQRSDKTCHYCPFDKRLNE